MLTLTRGCCANPNCVGWPLQPADRFCGWCGVALQTLRAVVEFAQDGEWRVLPFAVLPPHAKPNQVRIRLTPVRGGTAEDWSCELAGGPEWMQWTRGPDGRTFALTGLDAPAGGRLRDELRFEAADGEVAVPIHIGAEPGWLPPSEQRVVLPVAEEEPLTFLLSVSLGSGLALLQEQPLVEGLQASAQWGEALPRLLRPGESAVVRVAVDPGQVAAWRRQLLSRTAGPLMVPIALVVPHHWCGLRQTSLSGLLHLQLPAELNIVSREGSGAHHRWSSFSGGALESRFTLHLRNGVAGQLQRADLRFDSVCLEPPDCGVRLRNRLPAQLKSGESCEVQLERVDPSRLPSEALKLHVAVSGGGLQTVYLHHEVVEPQPFPGWVSLDLGHSNLCMAAFDGQGPGQLLRWSGEVGTSFASSTLLYRRALPKREFVCGNEALRAAATPGGEQAVVLSPKHAFQYGRGELTLYPECQPEHCLKLSPDQALADQVQFVLDECVRGLRQIRGAECLPAQVLLCHPTRMSARQLQAFTIAVQSSLKAWCSPETAWEPRVELVCEPVAAALEQLTDIPLLERLGPVEGQDGFFHVLVVDCGGQTLDLSLLAIHARRAGSQWLVSPRVVAVDGFPNSGGAWVTEQLAELWLARHPMDSGSLTSVQRRALLVLCEQWKTRPAERDAIEDELAGFARRLGLLRGSESFPSEQELAEATASRLQQAARVAQNLVSHAGGGAQVAAVLLTGQGARYEPVQRAFSAAFPRALSLLSRQLKECCALGCGHHPLVAMSGGLRVQVGSSAGRVDIQLPQEHLPPFTTSRWGIKAQIEGESRFWEVIRAGTVLPPDGLSVPVQGCELRPGLNRITVLENIGHDEVLQGNPEICVVGEADLEMPAQYFGKNVELRFSLSPQLACRLSLIYEGRKVGDATVR